MEKSFVAYALRYPQAAPLPDMDGVQFNVDVISPRAQLGPSPRFDGMERHGDFAEMPTAASASFGQGGASLGECSGGDGAAQDGLELAALGRSDSEGRCADSPAASIRRALVFVTSRAVPMDCPSGAKAQVFSAPKTRATGFRTSAIQSASTKPRARVS